MALLSLVSQVCLNESDQLFAGRNVTSFGPTGHTRDIKAPEWWLWAQAVGLLRRANKTGWRLEKGLASHASHSLSARIISQAEVYTTAEVLSLDQKQTCMLSYAEHQPCGSF